MKTLAHFFSIVLHPLMMPFYGMILFFTISYLAIYPLMVRSILTGVVLLFTYILPALAIFALYKLKVISHYSLNNRSERFWPYIICLSCYVGCGFILYRSGMPMWVVGYMIGATVSVIINIIITRWWKISAHLTGMGGLLGAMFALCQIQQTFPLGLIVTLVLLTGILGTSRILLGRHTLMQVIAGTANGFICVYLGSLLPVW